MSRERLDLVVDLIHKAGQQDSDALNTLASLAIANTSHAFLEQDIPEERRNIYELTAARIVAARLPQWIQAREQTPPGRLTASLTNFTRAVVNVTPTVFLCEQAAQGDIQAQNELLKEAEEGLYQYFHPNKEESIQLPSRAETLALQKLREKLIPHMVERVREDTFLQTISPQEVNLYARAIGFSMNEDLKRRGVTIHKREQEKEAEEQAERKGRSALPFHTILYVAPDFPCPTLHEQDSHYQYRLTTWMNNNGLPTGRVVNEIGFRAKLLHYALQGLNTAQIETMLDSSTTEESINATTSLLRKDLVKFIQEKNKYVLQLEEYVGTSHLRRQRGREQKSPLVEEIKYAIVTGVCEGLEVLDVFFVDSDWIKSYQENNDTPLKPSELKVRKDKYLNAHGKVKRNINRLADLNPLSP